MHDPSKVIILTRPRRFGKTLNLSMLKYFFEHTANQKKNNALFKNLKIFKYPDCMQHQGKFPVIFVSFKDIKELSFEAAIYGFSDLVKDLYSLWQNVLLKSNKISDNDKILVKTTLAQKLSEYQLKRSIKNLVNMIYAVTKQQIYILIDEYDTPVQEAYINGYYDQLIAFMRGFLGGVLKDNISVKQSILTGILRISKESLFSDLNNVEVYSVLHNKYADYFGFAEQEINDLSQKTNIEIDFLSAKEWYNGYKFGEAVLYNPWSILRFMKQRGKIDAYWINTSGNQLIKNLLINSSIETQDKIGVLIAGGVIEEIIDENIVFKDLDINRTAVWSLLLMSGYLNALSSEFTEYGNLCKLKIPNKEIEFLYKQIFRERLYGNRGIAWYQELLTSLTTGKIADFEIKLQQYIDFIASYHDTKKNTQEIFYQGFMLGILSGLKDDYEIKSNRESGFGRYDLLIMPKHDLNKLGIIMEFKAINDSEEAKLLAAARAALEQIQQSKYTNELVNRGVANICSIGAAFSGKTIKIISN